MKVIAKYHSLILFLIYTAALSFKTVTYVDAFVLTFLAAYIGLSFFMEYHKQPDIKGEVMGTIQSLEASHSETIKSLIYRYETDIKKLDNDMKEMKSKVASISSLKSVGLSQTNIKF